jgi:squalene-hopene/tetraprenyl-beta-curcumene cyclase
MTFLLVETKAADEEFERAWKGWQAEQGLSVSTRYGETGLAYNHLPFLLYEYFPRVPLRAARAVALAARALSLYAIFQTSVRRGALDTPAASAACEWLKDYSLSQWRSATGGSPIEDGRLRCHCEYRAALDDEQRRLSPPPRPYPAAQFLEVMRGKTALARATSAALAGLAQRADVLGPLTESQDYLYAGLQLSHEVVSWKKDFAAGSWTYPLVRLFTDVTRQDPPENDAERQARLPELSRDFYYSGLAGHLLATASEYFCRAMAAVTELPPNGWGALLTGLLERNDQLRGDIRQICAQRVAQARAVEAARAPVARAVPTIAFDSALEAEVRGALDDGTRYLAQAQAASGAWGDFMLLGEQSTFWVTGYVGWTLQGSAEASADLPRAARWLLDQQFAEGGWGYNSHWPEDADSIANVLLFLSGRPEVEPAAWAPALEVLWTHQRPDGGFSTIVDAEAWLSRFRSRTDDLSGWTGSHPCVTAVVALLLANLEGGRHRDRALRAADYLRGQQRPEGHWDAYWWGGRLYTTARAAQAMRALGREPDESCLARAREWLLGSQLADGSWAGSEEAAGQPFHTALGLQALYALGANDPADHDAIRAARWLLARQLRDGSWPAVPILRVPHPRTVRPWEQGKWRESIVGLDVIVPDWRRLFTTATAVQALRPLAAQRTPVASEPSRVRVTAG